jgi:hypothetical protein
LFVSPEINGGSEVRKARERKVCTRFQPKAAQKCFVMCFVGEKTYSHIILVISQSIKLKTY